MKIDNIICVLGWEERFFLGMELLLEKHDIKKIILVLFDDYTLMDNMSENMTKVIDLASKNGIEIEEIKLNYSDSISNWKILGAFFHDYELGNEVIINTTTFPRETIWTLLFFLKQKLQHLHYAYFKPLEYDKDWLTNNHGNPRLLFKHSGVFDLNKELVLFIITGFDSNRVESMIEFYQPSKVVLFCQNGEQFDNLKRNKGFHSETIIEFENKSFDSYEIASATQILDDEIMKHKDYNIIIASQGPKTSAISTYKSYLMSDNQVALAYVPAKDFSPKYSIGIDPNSIEGKFEFD